MFSNAISKKCIYNYECVIGPVAARRPSIRPVPSPQSVRPILPAAPSVRLSRPPVPSVRRARRYIPLRGTVAPNPAPNRGYAIPTTKNSPHSPSQIPPPQTKHHPFKKHPLHVQNTSITSLIRPSGHPAATRRPWRCGQLGKRITRSWTGCTATCRTL